MSGLEIIQGGKPPVLPHREPRTEGEWFQLIVDQLHALNTNHVRTMEEIRLQGAQISDLEQTVDKDFSGLPRMVADHDARIKILERMYWRVTGILLAVSAGIGFVEWLLSRHP